jgi:UDP-N-acetylglucosamine 2-epimerase
MRRYLSLLRIAAAMVGNSSSGIIEAPAVGLPVVNIGARQTGRLHAASIISCPADAPTIKAAIARAISPEFRAQARNTTLPYGRGGAAERIHQVLTDSDLSHLLAKKFVDRPMAGAR